MQFKGLDYQYFFQVDKRNKRGQSYLTIEMDIVSCTKGVCSPGSMGSSRLIWTTMFLWQEKPVKEGEVKIIVLTHTHTLDPGTRFMYSTNPRVSIAVFNVKNLNLVVCPGLNLGPERG